MTPSPLSTNFAHLLDGRARRRVAVTGLFTLATATLIVPFVFASSASAGTSGHHAYTSATNCSTTTTTMPTTTTTAGTTTTVADTTTTIADTTTTADTATTGAGTTTPSSAVGGITTPITEQSVGPPEVIQLGVNGAGQATLPVSAQAAGQLPRTGSSTLPAALGGLTLLVAGALAATTKRRRQLGVIPLNSKARP
jgi:LPXTG-motif cell wall-anchored protein